MSYATASSSVGGRMLGAEVGPAKLEYPANWKVIAPQQRGQFVTIAPRAGITPHGVGFGVLLNGLAPPKGERMNIDDVTVPLFNELEQNDALQQNGDIQPTTVAGVQGRSVDLNSVSPFPAANGKPQRESDRLVTVPQSDGAVNFMMCIAPQSEFDRFKPTYEAMLKRLKF